MMELLIAALAFEMCYPFALVYRERWKAKQACIDGRQLVFTGSALSLFGNWIKWLLLSVVTLGIYVFWVGPRVQKWIWEHTALASSDAGRTSPNWPAPSL
ncbi:MAG TPA: DUF898 family protein [Ilumatobacteraceae bacterium]|nr:DUF898 family protein [Ilumatobacteraceae bacterium]